jgi:pimeloyl-ACP methyl ester carboxylesterase
MIEKTITLPDGRLLGYGLYGNPLGIPIVDFHGIPGSRREAELIASYINRDDLCLIGFDRPGYGRSSPKRNYKITDLPIDLSYLADHLKLDRVIALGFSGGGPFALACAAQIPERLASVGIVAGVGPADIGAEGMHESNKKKFNLAQTMPSIARLMLTVAFSNLRHHPDKVGPQLEKLWLQMPETDQSVLQDKTFSQKITDITLDSIQKTVKGWVDEEILMTKPWQFNLSEIIVPNLFLWHGEQDRNVPVSMAKAIADRISACQATFFADEGHLSIIYNHGSEIINTLVKAAGF